jgi:transposase
MSKYSLETKLAAIKLNQQGYGAIEIAEKLHVKSQNQVRDWLLKYKAYGVPGLRKQITNKTYSGDFKLEVLNWRKTHNQSYDQTALHFHVFPASTIARWQLAYNKDGVEALFTKQGRPPMTKKPKKQKKLTSSELSELKKLRLENRALRVENAYLKKLDALVQKRGHLPKKDGSSKN